MSAPVRPAASFRGPVSGPRFVLGFYEVNRAYGGPEEGGWWYDTGRLVRVIRVERNAETAYAKAARANRILDYLQADLRSVGSVLYDGGRHRVRVFAGTAPEYYPVERPHYE